MTNYEKLKQMTFDEMESEIKCLVRWLKPMPNTEIDYCVLKYLVSETRETNKRKIDKFVVVGTKISFKEEHFSRFKFKVSNELGKISFFKFEL